jgi:hypothetical protein
MYQKESNDDETSSNLEKRSSKPIVYNGYSLDVSIEKIKTMRFCHANEVCKFKYKSYFECICPKSTLCVAQGSLFDGKCSNHLMPYVWIQKIDESIIRNSKNKKKNPIYQF